jgi:hypothetical protein
VKCDSRAHAKKARQHCFARRQRDASREERRRRRNIYIESWSGHTRKNTRVDYLSDRTTREIETNEHNRQNSPTHTNTSQHITTHHNTSQHALTRPTLIVVEYKQSICNDGCFYVWDRKASCSAQLTTRRRSQSVIIRNNIIDLSTWLPYHDTWHGQRNPTTDRCTHTHQSISCGGQFVALAAYRQYNRANTTMPVIVYHCVTEADHRAQQQHRSNSLRSPLLQEHLQPTQSTRNVEIDHDR